MEKNKIKKSKENLQRSQKELKTMCVHSCEGYKTKTHSPRQTAAWVDSREPVLWWQKMIWLWVADTQCEGQILSHRNHTWTHVALWTNVTPINSIKIKSTENSLPIDGETIITSETFYKKQNRQYEAQEQASCFEVYGLMYWPVDLVDFSGM